MGFSRQLKLFSIATISTLSAVIVAVPASAQTNSVISLSQTTFDSQTVLPSLTASITQTEPGGNPSNLQPNDVDVRTLQVQIRSQAFDPWTINEASFPSCTPGTGRTAAQCGITINVGGVDKSSLVTVSRSGQSINGDLYLLVGFPFPDGSQSNFPRSWSGPNTVFEVTFANDLLRTSRAGFATITVSQLGFIYGTPLAGNWGGPYTANSGSRSVIVNSTVTFDSDGGSGTLNPQASMYSAPLSANVLTKSGYTFGGWATSQSDAAAGTVAYADGANYNFSTGGTRTLYAIWTAVVSNTTPATTTPATTAPATTTPAARLATTGSSLSVWAPGLALGLGWVLVAYSRSLRASRARHLKI